MRVSRSGAWMSVMRPHSNRERSLRFEGRDRARRPIRGDDDLPAGLVERVERVEELLLDPLLVLEELDVVDEKHVVVAVALLEAFDALVAERVDEVVHEDLARHVARGEIPGVLADVARDRLQEMGLPKPGAAVDEERVVRLRWRFCDRQCRCVREAVRGADDEEVERVLRVQALAEARRRWRLGVLRLVELANGEPNRPVGPDRLADRGMDEIEEVILDPRAREVVRNGKHEVLAAELDRLSVGEPRREGGFAQCVPEAVRDLGPQ